MANTIVKKASGVDSKMTRLIARFENQIQDTRWRVEECNIDAGPAPGMTTIVMRTPAGAVDVLASSMAFNINNMGWLRAGARCAVDKVFPTGGGAFAKQTVYVGSVVDVDHDRDRGLIVTLLDDRWLLSNVRVIGRWIYDPNNSVSPGPYYQQGWGAHFNPGGRPNKIYGDPVGNGVNIPMFTPYPDYGLVDGQEPPSSTSTDNNDQNNLIRCASYWTMGDICNYLWAFYSATGYTGVSAQTKKFPWIERAPSTLKWPVTYAAGVDSESVANFDNAVGQTNQNKGAARKGREIVLEGMALLDALHLLLTTAGGYTVGLVPQAGQDSTGTEIFQNELKIVPTRYLSDKNAVAIPMAVEGQAKNVLTQATINAGNFKTSARDYKTAVAGAGQLVFIEQTVSTKTADGAQLRLTQTAARFDLFRTLLAGSNITLNGVAITAAGTANSTAVWAQALRLFPEMMATWRLNETFDYQAGTDQSAYPRAQIARPPWPTLLSLVSDAGAFDYAGMHAPVWVEIETSPGTWKLFGQFDQFEIWDNGNIYLPLMREPSQATRVWKYNSTPTNIVAGKLDISMLEIRMTLAIPCDHRLTNVCASAEDFDVAAGVPGSIYVDNPDVDMISADLKRRDYRDLQELYVCWLRKNSYSRPRSLGWSQDVDKVAATAAGALRYDGEALGAHIKRAMWDANRLQKSGNPRFDGYLVTSYQPGTQVKEFTPLGSTSGQKPFPIRAALSGICLRSLEDKVSTELKF